MFADLMKEFHADKENVVMYYDQYFWDRRLSIGSVLEIGSSPNSMKMFHKAFPNASIFAVDIVDRRCDGMTVYHGDYKDTATHEWIRQHGPYDLIIDDADHDPTNVIHVFNRIKEYTKQYIIEDCAIFCLRKDQENFYAGLVNHIMHMQVSVDGSGQHRKGDVKEIHKHGIEEIIIRRNFMLFNLF